MFWIRKGSILILLIYIFLSILLLVGCQTQMISTDNPTDPEADSPIIIDETPATRPWGCMMWKEQSIETPGVWYPKQKCCPLEPDNNDGWELVSWDC